MAAGACMVRPFEQWKAGLSVADDIIREVNEEVRAEQMRVLARRYGGVAIGVVVVALCVIGGWQYNAWRTRQAVAEAAGRYFAASQLATSTHVSAGTAPLSDDQKKAVADFRAIAQNGPEGLRTLSSLRLASLAMGSGDKAGALAAWQTVRDDPAADPALRALANLLWVQNQLDTADPAALRQRLETLTKGHGAWRGLAQEALAMLDLRDGHEADSRRILAGLSQDPDAPDGVRARAGALLQTFAAAPTGAPAADK